ncbi:DUF2776 family protein [Arthrobacter sp. zg-Y1143]|uniref:DUF2776 family protein n=1 Tax=Arthrobacter sp. zg-Y1143 TaxID=3049065 RepID=UPI0024C32243|nr:DUF2776 family protein [Arthrobacter sp. zg-Y1143]MDK1327941.1 DUF2776 family protein [Arthrobacter sp. zg-Y1143]
MNATISVIFRAIPLLMGAVCLTYGLYILAGPDDASHFVAGHVNIGLTAICYALFTTAATIIRQLINRYGRVWGIILPLSGYVAAAAAIIWGIVLANRDNTTANLTAGFVVMGVGFVAACVSTVAAASTKFTLIQSAKLLDPLGGPPEGAHSRTVGAVLIAVPAAAAIAGFSLATGLLVRGDRSRADLLQHPVEGAAARPRLAPHVCPGQPHPAQAHRNSTHLPVLRRVPL